MFQCTHCGKDPFGSAPSPKSRWCKRIRVLSKWSPADCWPLCLFPSIMPCKVSVCVGGEGCLFACKLDVCASERLWKICLCRWLSNLSCSYSAKHIQPWPRPCLWWRESCGSFNQLRLFWQWEVLLLRIYGCILSAAEITIAESLTDSKNAKRRR